jgi:hypothetical protein
MEEKKMVEIKVVKKNETYLMPSTLFSISVMVF